MSIIKGRDGEVHVSWFGIHLRDKGAKLLYYGSIIGLYNFFIIIIHNPWFLFRFTVCRLCSRYSGLGDWSIFHYWLLLSLFHINLYSVHIFYI